MEVGSAIKMLRKRKGYSQKDLAHECGLSVNALSLIENNSTFPKKATIKKVCEVLDIPTAYLLFFSISDEDVPIEKRESFRDLTPYIEKLLLGNRTDETKEEA